MVGFLKKSPWILHYDASSCNGCDIETLACLCPIFDVERLGVVNTGNPKHADIFLVTGAVNNQSGPVIRNLYRQMPEPKTVVAVGACACSGGIFRECYNITGGVDGVIPVDVYVPGCAARPEAIIDGVVKALEVMEKKHAALKQLAGQIDQTVYAPADKSDAPQILTLQRIAYQSYEDLYDEENVPPLMETLDELTAVFETTRFIKASVNGQLIGAARACQHGPVVEVGRIMVHPFFKGQGIGYRLLAELEKSFPDVKRFEAIIASKDDPGIAWMKRQGYERTMTEVATPAITRIHLQKECK